MANRFPHYERYYNNFVASGVVTTTATSAVTATAVINLYNVLLLLSLLSLILSYYEIVHKVRKNIKLLISARSRQNSAHIVHKDSNFCYVRVALCWLFVIC